jgi:hypothetical protein
LFLSIARQMGPISMFFSVVGYWMRRVLAGETRQARHVG